MIIMWVEGNLTNIISPACCSLLLVTLLSSLSLSLLMTIMLVEGNLTNIISPACYSLLLVTLLSSLSLLMTIMFVEGNLTNIISPACSSFLLVTLLSSLSSDDHCMVIYITLTCGMLLLESTASRYPLITLLQEGFHSCRDFIPLAIGVLYMLSCRTVGVKKDGNFCPYLLSPTTPAPRTRCIGDSVARFARPFESRPADPVRREVFRQLASSSSSSTSTGWVAPKATISAPPRPLDRATEESSSRAVPLRPEAKRRLQF